MARARRNALAARMRGERSEGCCGDAACGSVGAARAVMLLEMRAGWPSIVCEEVLSTLVRATCLDAADPRLTTAILVCSEAALCCAYPSMCAFSVDPAPSSRRRVWQGEGSEGVVVFVGAAASAMGDRQWMAMGQSASGWRQSAWAAARAGAGKANEWCLRRGDGVVVLRATLREQQ